MVFQFKKETNEILQFGLHVRCEFGIVNSEFELISVYWSSRASLLKNDQRIQRNSWIMLSIWFVHTIDDQEIKVTMR